MPGVWMLWTPPACPAGPEVLAASCVHSVSVEQIRSRLERREPSANALQNATLDVKNSGVMTSKATEVARRYHDTWNGRDVNALVSSFTKDGIFCNPDTYPGINGEALATFVNGVWEAIPDFSIELLNAGEIEPDVVAHHWLIKGTNKGKAFSFKGASILHVEGDKIRSDENYFDRKALE